MEFPNNSNEGEYMTKLKQTTTTISQADLSIKREVRRLKANTARERKVNAVIPVNISEITDNGFRLQVLNRDYYLTRERYPYFSDATEAEIRDVVLKWENRLHWEALDLDFTLEVLDHPEKSVRFCHYVRGVPRPDLFEGFLQFGEELDSNQ